MLTNINPKLPMRNKRITKEYYINKLGFSEIGEYDGYLMVEKDAIELHFLNSKISIQTKITDKFILEPIKLIRYTKHF